MDKNQLKEIVVDQKSGFEKKHQFIERKVSEKIIKSSKITAIVGVRRCGKSTLLKQLKNRYPGYYYLNFEDERLLDFQVEDFNNLLEIFFTLYDHHSVFFFDEIQNIVGWEKFVSRLYGDGYKVFVTGSSAKLLSSELSTSLTGRHQKIELYPFSWLEYLQYHDFQNKKIYTTKEKSQINKLFDRYLLLGGFPEVVQSRDSDELKQLYQDILIKDIIVRYQIKDVQSFRELSLYILSNPSTLISYNNLAKILKFQSVSTVKNYFEFLESSYLYFLISKYDYSVKKQIINNKKIYSIDTGLINAVSFSFSKNIGRLLENITFLELKRRNKEIYYHSDKHECDFVIKEKNTITAAIQVTQKIDGKNESREINGLLDAMNTYKLKTGLILTRYDDDVIKINRQTIYVKPIWKWLMQNNTHR